MFHVERGEAGGLYDLAMERRICAGSTWNRAGLGERLRGGALVTLQKQGADILLYYDS